MPEFEVVIITSQPYQPLAVLVPSTKQCGLLGEQVCRLSWRTSTFPDTSTCTLRDFACQAFATCLSDALRNPLPASGAAALSMPASQAIAMLLTPLLTGTRVSQGRGMHGDDPLAVSFIGSAGLLAGDTAGIRIGDAAVSGEPAVNDDLVLVILPVVTPSACAESHSASHGGSKYCPAYSGGHFHHVEPSSNLAMPDLVHLLTTASPQGLRTSVSPVSPTSDTASVHHSDVEGKAQVAHPSVPYSADVLAADGIPRPVPGRLLLSPTSYAGCIAQRHGLRVLTVETLPHAHALIASSAAAAAAAAAHDDDCAVVGGCAVMAVGGAGTLPVSSTAVASIDHREPSCGPRPPLLADAAHPAKVMKYGQAVLALSPLQRATQHVPTATDAISLASAWRREAASSADDPSPSSEPARSQCRGYSGGPGLVAHNVRADPTHCPTFNHHSLTGSGGHTDRGAREPAAHMVEYRGHSGLSPSGSGATAGWQMGQGPLSDTSCDNMATTPSASLRFGDARHHSLPGFTSPAGSSGTHALHSLGRRHDLEYQQHSISYPCVTGSYAVNAAGACAIPPSISHGALIPAPMPPSPYPHPPHAHHKPQHASATMPPSAGSSVRGGHGEISQGGQSFVSFGQVGRTFSSGAPILREPTLIEAGSMCDGVGHLLQGLYTSGTVGSPSASEPTASQSLGMAPSSHGMQVQRVGAVPPLSPSSSVSSGLTFLCSDPALLQPLSVSHGYEHSSHGGGFVPSGWGGGDDTSRASATFNHSISDGSMSGGTASRSALSAATPHNVRSVSSVTTATGGASSGSSGFLQHAATPGVSHPATSVSARALIREHYTATTSGSYGFGTPSVGGPAEGASALDAVRGFHDASGLPGAPRSSTVSSFCRGSEIHIRGWVAAHRALNAIESAVLWELMQKVRELGVVVVVDGMGTSTSSGIASPSTHSTPAAISSSTYPRGGGAVASANTARDTPISPAAFRELLRKVQEVTHLRDEDRLAAMGDAGFVELTTAVLQLAAVTLVDELAVSLVCQSIGNLALNAHNRMRYADSGVLEVMSDIFTSFRTALTPVKDVIVAIRHLAYKNDGNKHLMLQLGIVGSIVQALLDALSQGGSSISAQLQRQAFGALAILTAHSSVGLQIKLAVLQAGGLEACIACLRVHGDDVPLVAAAAKAMSTLVTVSTAREEAVANDAVGLLEALVVHPPVAADTACVDVLHRTIRRLRAGQVHSQ